MALEPRQYLHETRLGVTQRVVWLFSRDLGFLEFRFGVLGERALECNSVNGWPTVGGNVCFGCARFCLIFFH